MEVLGGWRFDEIVIIIERLWNGVSGSAIRESHEPIPINNGSQASRHRARETNRLIEVGRRSRDHATAAVLSGCLCVCVCVFVAAATIYKDRERLVPSTYRSGRALYSQTCDVSSGLVYSSAWFI